MSAKEIAVFLGGNLVFAGIPVRDLESLARVAREETHRARSEIFMEGDAARCFYLVRAGHLKIVRHSKTGKDVVLELLGPGEIFGGVTRQSLADMTGTTVETTIRILSRWLRDGVLGDDGGRLVLTD